jgi:hypothetical protein
MAVTFEYRLVNKLEQQFVYETLALMAVGIVLIVFFGSVLYKALTGSINSEYQHLRERRRDDINDAGSGGQHDGGSREPNYLTNVSFDEWRAFGQQDSISQLS